MIRGLILAALFAIIFLQFSASAVRADTDAVALDDDKLNSALIDALDKRRCDEAARLIEEGNTRVFLRPIFRYFQGVMFQFGVCAPQDWTRAADAYRAAALLGDDTSRLRLGRFYLEGLGVEQDQGKAREWFTRLMYGLVGDAKYARLAWLRKWWGKGELPDLLMAELAWLRRVEGDPRSRMRVAGKILAGDGLPRDARAAEKWLRSAVDEKLPEATLMLARWLMGGKIKQVYKNEGALTLHRVATFGYPPAMVELAMRLIAGDGVGKSATHAYPYLLRAKRAGAAVDEQLATLAARLTKSQRQWGERKAKGGAQLPVDFR